MIVEIAVYMVAQEDIAKNKRGNKEEFGLISEIFQIKNMVNAKTPAS